MVYNNRFFALKKGTVEQRIGIREKWNLNSPSPRGNGMTLEGENPLICTGW